MQRVQTVRIAESDTSLPESHCTRLTVSGGRLILQNRYTILERSWTNEDTMFADGVPLLFVRAVGSIGNATFGGRREREAAWHRPLASSPPLADHAYATM